MDNTSFARQENLHFPRYSHSTFLIPHSSELYIAKVQFFFQTSKFHGKKSLHCYFVVFAAGKRPQMSWSKLCYEVVIALLLHNQKGSRRKGHFFAFSEIAHARYSSNYIRLSAHSIAILPSAKSLTLGTARIIFGSPLTQSRFLQ